MNRSKAFKLEPVIGLEVHIELATNSKMFCLCPADHFAKPPNSQVCPTCLGLPGSLPVPNKKAIEWTILVGLALNCKIERFSKFDRKHYFYPDLPKGYQISQYDQPLCSNGLFQLSGSGKKVRIRRIHLEEDTGKMIHTIVKGERVSLLDFNRSGVPLVEIVTEPDFKSSQEAKLFLIQIQRLVRWLGISDGDMEKGSMRLEANVSLSSNGEIPAYKVEIKNINSFKFVEKAIDYEIERQKKIIEGGGELRQETRGFNEKTGITLSQRVKEEAKDYRYFPEPDIPPLVFGEREIEEIRSKLPQLPWQIENLFRDTFRLSIQYSQFLASSKKLADYFIKAVKVASQYNIPPKTVADEIVNKKPDIEKISEQLLVSRIRKRGEKVLISDSRLENIVKKVIFENAKAVNDYRKGKVSAIQYLVGQVVKLSGGKADVRKTHKMLLERLK